MSSAPRLPSRRSVQAEARRLAHEAKPQAYIQAFVGTAPPPSPELIARVRELMGPRSPAAIAAAARRSRPVPGGG